MIDYRKNISIIGFDLDQTLYPKSPEIDATIQGYIYEKVAEHKKVSVEEAKKLFKDRYQDGRGLGGRATLVDLGISNASEIVQEALERADIAEFLKPNPETVAVLTRLSTHYHSLDLITGSNRSNTNKKLSHLEIPAILFSHILTEEDGLKSNGEAYRLWLSLYPSLTPSQFLYIGDRVASDYEAPKKLGIHSILVNVAKPDTSFDAIQLTTLREIEDYV